MGGMCSKNNDHAHGKSGHVGKHKPTKQKPAIKYGTKTFISTDEL